MQKEVMVRSKPIETVVDQGTDAWHEFRALGFGGSEANLIAGFTKYQTVLDLWKFKTGQEVHEIKINDAMQHGIDTEPEARKQFELATGVSMIPKCFEHSEYPFIRASLDGINDSQDLILEIKCPSRFGIHMKTVRGVIPEYYYPQIQHQLFVTGAELACFWSYVPTMGGFMLEIKPNPKYIDELVRREKLLWEHVVNKTEPDLADFPLMTP